MLVTALALLALVSVSIAVGPRTFLADLLVLTDIDGTVRAPRSTDVILVRVAFAVLGLGLLGTATVLLRARTRVLAILSACGADARDFMLLIRGDARALARSLGAADHCVLAIALLVGLGLRIETMRLPIAYDEAHTYVLFVSRGMLDVLSDYTMPNNQILHSILAHFSVALFGDSLTALRLPALLAGGLIVPFAVWLLARLFDARTAVLAGSLVAVAPPLVDYSGQARGYSLLALFFLIGFLVATYLVERPTRTGWVAFAGSCALALYTIPTAIFGVALISSWMLLSVPASGRRSLVRGLAASGVAVAAGVLFLYSPAIARSRLPEIPRTTLSELPARAGEVLPELLDCWAHDLPGWGQFVIALGALVAVISSLRDRRLLRLLLALFAGLIPLMVVQRVVPPVRALHFLFPIVVGVSAFGLKVLVDRLASGLERGRTVIWLGATLVLVAGWTGSRLAAIRDDGLLARAGPAGSCTGGYFLDAEQIATRMTPNLRAGGVLVAPVFSGAVESTRYYLMTEGISPVRVHPYVAERGVEQLADYTESYVIIPGSGIDRETLPQMLGISETSLAAAFLTPEPVLELGTSTVVLLRPRVTPGRSPSDEELRSNMFYAW